MGGTRGPVGLSPKRTRVIEARPSGRRGGTESEASVVPLWLGLPVGDWIALLAYRFR